MDRDNAIHELHEALKEAMLQIEYLHQKFKVTASGNAVLSRISRVMEKYEVVR